MNLYEDQFLEKNDFSRVNKPTKILIIASTGRCGSHMLGHALHKTQQFGFPLEYANGDNLVEWKKRLGLENINDVMKEIQARRTSENGVFGIKIHYAHIQQFGGFDKLVEAFPDAYYVHLSRSNVLKQAVSLSIASQTGVWIAGQTPVNDNPEYDFKHIQQRLKATIQDNASWKYTLSASGCNYIEMNFDDVQKNLANSINTIANFMGVEIDQNSLVNEQVTKKQSSNLNQEWMDRFIRDFDLSDELITVKKENKHISRVSKTIQHLRKQRKQS